MIEIKLHDHVLCSRLGEEEFEVVEISEREYKVKSTLNGAVHPIYKAHCHTTPAISVSNARRRVAVRLERSESIGRPKTKPGKRK